MRKSLSTLLILCLALSLLPITARAADRTLTLTEDWRLTSDLDLNVGAGDLLTIDGTNTRYIYELGGVLLNTGAGLVVLKDTILYPAGGSPADGSIAALIAAAAGVHSITAPAQDATSLALPTVPGYDVEIKTSSNLGVISLDGTVAPPASATTVDLVLTLTGNGGKADTSSISVTVPAALSLSITTASLPGATVGSAYSRTIAKAYTGAGTVTFSATGLPDGLSISTTTGIISGTPASGADADSPYSVDVEATDGTVTDGKTYSLTVTPAHSGGGVPANPEPTYNADISDGGSVPVNVNTDAGSASLNLSSISGSLSGGGNTAIDVPAIPGVNSYTANLPASSLTSGGGSLMMNTTAGSLTIPGDMLSGTGLSGTVGVTIGAGSKANLPDDLKAALGNRPLIQLTLTIDGKQTAWDNQDAPVKVSIPYTPTAEELANSESIVVWYIDGSGKAVSVPNGHYDPVTGTVTFATTHFSNYAVAYSAVRFNDVAAGAWCYDAVCFIAARSITGGTGGGNYSPDAKLTRGDFLVLLMRAYGIAPDTNPIDNFADAGNTYYTGYLSAAKRLGITTGVGGNMYAPGREITRQEMFTLLYNALKVINQLPQGDSGKLLADFTDAEQVDSWAKDAMTLLVKTGTVGGNAGKLTPTGTTTRAEMAQVLYNLLSK